MGRGIIFPDMSIRVLPQVAKLAEDAGYDSYWVTESRGQDGFIRLGAVAQATSRIEIGTGIAYAFSRSPVATAGTIADVDEISGGRVIAGLGAGTKYMRKLWYNVDWEHPATQMKEYVEVMRAVWNASNPPQSVTYNGTFYQIDIARMTRSNMARPTVPVYAAALNPAMIRAAAEAYDGIALFPLALAKPYFEQVVLPNIEIGAKRAGKNPKDVKIAAWLLTAVDKDEAEAKRHAQHSLSFYFSTRSYGVVADLCGFSAEKQRVLEIASANRANPDTEAMADAISDGMIDMMTLTGTPDQVRKKIAAFEERVDTLVIEGGGEGGRNVPDPIGLASITIDALSR